MNFNDQNIILTYYQSLLNDNKIKIKSKFINEIELIDISLNFRGIEEDNFLIN